MRLGIIVPQSQGLNENHSYLPMVIQGTLVDNINRYSAISVLDRVSLDRVITETLDPTYEDNLDIVRLGHVAQVGYMLTGNIIRTATGFTLNINVTDTTTNANTIASHSGTYTEAQFNNHTAMNRASLDLLTQMGVALTTAARNELAHAGSRQSINAQAALAQGIVAQRQGQAIEAIFHYFDASALEATATEALSRMSTATTTIATGSLGDRVRNDIQQRSEWIRLIEETRRFFANYPHYLMAELHFRPTLDLAGINYEAETAQLTFPVQVHLNLERTEAVKKIITDISNGLAATGRRQQWGIEVSVEPFLLAYEFNFDLLNERGRVISSTSPRDAVLLYFSGQPSHEISLFIGVRGYDNLRIERITYPTYNGSHLYLYAVGSLPYRIARREPFDLSIEHALNQAARWSSRPRFSVRATEISDSMTIRLSNVRVYDLFQQDRRRRNYKLVTQGSTIISVNPTITARQRFEQFDRERVQRRYVIQHEGLLGE